MNMIPSYLKPLICLEDYQKVSYLESNVCCVYTSIHLCIILDPVFASPLHQRFVVEKQSRQAASGSFSQASHSTPHMLTLRRHVHETLAVRSGLNVKMRTTNASIADKMVMMSVELENPVETDCVFMVDKVEVHVSNSVVSSAFAKEVRKKKDASSTYPWVTQNWYRWISQ